jgi:hypothetical protein
LAARCSVLPGWVEAKAIHSRIDYAIDEARDRQKEDSGQRFISSATGIPTFARRLQTAGPLTAAHGLVPEMKDPEQGEYG